MDNKIFHVLFETEEATFRASFRGEKQEFKAAFGDVSELVPIYTGDYFVTPGDEAITLATDGKRMTENITVNPIPSNYGRITWNGSVMTVS